MPTARLSNGARWSRDRRRAVRVRSPMATVDWVGWWLYNAPERQKTTFWGILVGGDTLKYWLDRLTGVRTGVQYPCRGERRVRRHPSAKTGAAGRVLTSGFGWLQSRMNVGGKCMSFIAIPGTVRVQMLFEQQGQKCENVFHVKKAAVWTEASEIALAGMFRSWWGDQLKVNVANSLALKKVIVADQTTETSPAIEFAASGGDVGSGGASDMPMNVTVAVRWTTGLRGRCFRGRSYHLGLTSTQVLGSTLLAAEVFTLTDAYFALINLVATQGAQLVVASLRVDNAPRIVGLATPIIGCSIESTLDSQRRRLPGRGN